MAGRDCRGNSEGQPQTDLKKCAAQHHLLYVEAVGAEGHANADLACALRDCIGGYAVEADRRESQRYQTEEGRELDDHALLAESEIHLVSEALIPGDHEVWIDGLQRAAHPRLEFGH